VKIWQQEIWHCHLCSTALMPTSWLLTRKVSNWWNSWARFISTPFSGQTSEAYVMSSTSHFPLTLLHKTITSFQFPCLWLLQ
jgi:hypothetical protein